MKTTILIAVAASFTMSLASYAMSESRQKTGGSATRVCETEPRVYNDGACTCPGNTVATKSGPNQFRCVYPVSKGTGPGPASK